MKNLGLFLGASLSLTSATALADYPADAPVKPFNLPDLAGLTSVRFDLQYTHAATEFTIPVPLTNVETTYTIFTFDLGADIEFAPHWVALVDLPFAHVGIDVDTDPDNAALENDDCCGFALGNLTLGARWLQSDVRGGGIRTVFGGEFSLSLPTASDDGDGAAAALNATISRASHDPTLYLFDIVTPKLLGHGQIYGEYFLLQAELGFYLPIYTGDNDNEDDTELLLRASFAAGARVTQEIALVLEFNNVVPLTSDDDEGDETASSLDFGLRYGSRGFVAGLRFFLPVDDRADDFDMWGIGADISARF